MKGRTNMITRPSVKILCLRERRNRAATAGHYVQGERETVIVVMAGVIAQKGKRHAQRDDEKKK